MSTQMNDPLHQLAIFRSELAEIDKELLSLLSQRFSIASQIGQIKKTQKMPIHQPEQWNRVKTDNLKQGKDLGLTESFLNKFLELIHDESIKRQQ